MNKIAITGRIGSGKSTALNYFKKLGNFTLSSDEIIKQIYNDSELREMLLKRLGVTSNDYRKEIINKIQDPLFNYKLKKNIYPLMNRLRRKMFPSFISKKKLFIEVPLLFEEKLENNYNIIIFIKSNFNLRRKRIIKKGMSEKYFKTMNDNQASDGPKETRSHIIIYNNSSSMDFFDNLNRCKKFL